MANSDANTEQSSNPPCSIAFAMHHVANAAGIDLNADDLCTALALHWLFCAAKDETPTDDFPFLARDMFLAPVARALGMTLREIHPPAAAHDLHGRHEFLQHFDASYAPIVKRALENGQSVLAWRGWSGDEERCWGLITDTCNEGVGLSGSVRLSASQEKYTIHSVLETPPVQIYVIEHVDPTTPSADELANMVLCHGRAILNDERGAEFGVITGPNAFRFLLASMDGASGKSEVGSDNSRFYASNLALFVRDLEIGIRSMRRWLCNASGRHADSLSDLLSKSEKLHSTLADVARTVDHNDAQPMDQSERSLRDALRRAIELSVAMRESLQSSPAAS